MEMSDMAGQAARAAVNERRRVKTKSKVGSRTLRTGTRYRLSEPV